MEAFPVIAIVTDDSVLASAIPAQIRHRYAMEVTVLPGWPQFRQLLATRPPGIAVIDLHHCPEALPQLSALQAEHPRMALIGIAQAGGQGESGAFASDLASLLPRPVSIPLLIHQLDQLRHRHSLSTVQQRLAFSGGVTFHPIEKTLRTPEAGIVELTDKEASLLAYLHRHPDEWHTRERLLEEIWGYDGTIDTHTLETHLYRLRTKLRPLWGQVEPVLSQQGGYRLNPELTQ